MCFRGVPLRDLILPPMAALFLVSCTVALAFAAAAEQQAHVVQNVTTQAEMARALDALTKLVNLVVAAVGFSSALFGAGAAWAVIRLRVQALEERLREKAEMHAQAVEAVKADVAELRREHLAELAEMRRVLYRGGSGP